MKYPIVHRNIGHDKAMASYSGSSFSKRAKRHGEESIPKAKDLGAGIKDDSHYHPIGA